MNEQEVCRVRLMATIVVFGVVMAQTLLLKITFYTTPDSFSIALVGFIVADVLAAATWILFSD